MEDEVRALDDEASTVQMLAAEELSLIYARPYRDDKITRPSRLASLASPAPFFGQP